MSKPLTFAQKQELKDILAEVYARDVELPPDVKDLIQGTKPPLLWNTNEYDCFTKADGTMFIPNDKQKPFIDSKAMFSALISGRAGGKTSSAAQKALQKIRDGENGAVMNPDFENFKLSTWPEFREWIPWENVIAKHKHRHNPEWKPNQPFDLVFENGVTVICKGLKNPDSARGPNINWLWYDEPGNDLDGASWQIASASVRIGKDPMCWASGTPKGKNHWIYEFFVEQDIPEDALEAFKKVKGNRPLIEVFYTTIADNESNLDAAFYARMLAMYPSGWLRQQELFGEFVDEGGILGDSSWFNGKIIPLSPEKVYKRVRYWDLAATEKEITGKKRNDPDETVGTKMSWDQKYFYIEDQHGGFWEWLDIKKQILETAKKDGSKVEIWVEQEPGSGGKNQVAEIANYIKEKLPGWPAVQGHLPKQEGDKVMRANYWFAEANLGLIFIVTGSWVKVFFKQLDSFPGRHDDKIDSVSGARLVLAPIEMWKKIKFLKI